MPSWVLAAIARVAAAAAAFVGTFLADKLGVEVTAEAVEALTASITMLGTFVFFLLYTIIRPLISRFLHPTDTAAAASKPRTL